MELRCKNCGTFFFTDDEEVTTELHFCSLDCSSEWYVANGRDQVDGVFMPPQKSKSPKKRKRK
jgi:hypothetical protein